MATSKSAAGTAETAAAGLGGARGGGARRQLVGDKLTSTLNKVNGTVEPNPSVESEAQKNERMSRTCAR